jgi:hypothetical protein
VIFAAVVAGPVALLGFGLHSGIEAMASVIVIWRFTGTRLASPTSKRCARQLAAANFFLLAPHIAVAIAQRRRGNRRPSWPVPAVVPWASTRGAVPLAAALRPRTH